MGSKKGKGQRFLVGAGVVALLAAAIVFGLVTSQQNNLSQKVAIARKAGFPFESKSLDVKPPFPGAKNAAPYYEKAISQQRALASRIAGEKAFDGLYSGLDASAQKDLDAYVKEMGPALDYMWQGSQADYCYFPKDWSKGAAVLFPEYAYLKAVAKAQSARAYLAATSGDREQAIEDYETLRTLARHLSEQPILIAMLVSIAIDAIRARSIEALFPLVLKDGSLSDWMRECVTAMPEAFDLTGPLKTEAYFLWWLTEQGHNLPTALGYKPDDAESIELTLMSRSQFVIRSVKMSVLDIYTPAIRDYRPTQDDQAVLETLDRRSMAVRAKSGVAGKVLDLFMMTFQGLADGLDRARFRRRSLLAALDVLDHRRKTGAWPSTLPVEFIDPYDGKPLRYRVDGDGFRIWSVGANLADDGGLTDRESKSGQGDEVLIYPRPAGTP